MYLSATSTNVSLGHDRVDAAGLRKTGEREAGFAFLPAAVVARISPDPTGTFGFHALSSEREWPRSLEWLSAVPF